MLTFDLPVQDFASPTLGDELTKAISHVTLADADPGNQLPQESVDAIEALAAQAAALAGLQKLEGSGHIEIVQGETGWQVQLFTESESHAHAQALDPARMSARVDARAAAASAAAKAAARKKGAKEAPDKPAPAGRAAPAPTRFAPQAPAATRPTVPPPRRA
jgi:hypothetical protein